MAKVEFCYSMILEGIRIYSYDPDISSGSWRMSDFLLENMYYRKSVRMLI